MFAALLCLLAQCAALAAPPKAVRSKYYSISVFYEPGGPPKGLHFRVSGKKFAIDKKYKSEKLYSSVEILGSVNVQDDRYLVDSWLQLEIATAATGGAISDTTLIKTVYSLKPAKKTLVFKSPAMSIWLQMEGDRGAPPKPGAKGARPAPPRATAAAPTRRRR